MRQAAITPRRAGHVPTSALKDSRAPRPIRMRDVTKRGRVRERAAAPPIKARSRGACGLGLSPSACPLKRPVNPAVSPPQVPIVVQALVVVLGRCFTRPPASPQPADLPSELLQLGQPHAIRVGEQECQLHR